MEEEAKEEEEEEAPLRVEWDGGTIDCIALLKDIIAYVLFTHHQIPQTVQLPPLPEFPSQVLMQALSKALNCRPFAQLEYNAVDTIVVDSNDVTSSTPSERRERNRKERALKKEIKNRQKLTESVQALLDALQAAFKELSCMPSVLLVLGSSTKQPYAAYDIQFHRICNISPYQDMQGSGKSSNLELLTKSLSKKITRALVSRDSGPLFTGPMKLFMFIKADATSYVPQGFVPKRDYTIRFRKFQKQAYLRVIQIIGTSPFASKGGVAASTMHENSAGCNDMIWFQCKLTVKGGQCNDIC